MTTRKTILLPGESNQMGFNSLTPAQTYTNASHIYVMRGDFSAGAASDPLVPGFNFGVGPGMALADRYISQAGISDLELCLIPILGLHAADYQIGTVIWNVVAEAIIAANRTWGPIAGAHYVQGINDVSSGGFNAWRWDVRRFFYAMRGLNSAIGGADFPISIAELPANAGSVANWDTMQGWIADIPNDMARTGVVHTSDLAVNGSGDNNHWTAASQVTHGHRAADVLLAL